MFLLSAALGAGASLAFALLARSYVTGLVFFSLVALAQGETYAPAIMLVADRSRTPHRDAAIGWLVGNTALGYTSIAGDLGRHARAGQLPSSLFRDRARPARGLALAWIALTSTPNIVHSRRKTVGLVGEVLSNRAFLRLTTGYAFYNWELLGMWAWTPAFVAASLLASGSTGAKSVKLGAYLAAAFHVMGFVASSTMGQLSDRLGQRAVMVGLAATNTACSFAFGWLIGGPVVIVAVVGALYAFAALGDSPVLLTALTESVDPAYLSSALALCSFVGFAAGAIASLVFGMVLDATNAPHAAPATWGWAFATFGCGGLIATICAAGFRRPRARTRPPADAGEN